MNDTAPCEKCDTEISTDALVCPNCQFNARADMLKGAVLFLFLGGIVLMVGLLSFWPVAALGGLMALFGLVMFPLSLKAKPTNSFA